ncbi:MAG: hypothetical protein CMH25_03995 [Micavibrio sp.]|nr:hypothetical protein [Micavibrio sp.]|tara:strand:+ start:249 stop:743 length:495 start_codon:yes stop_codon:yes gene_type:complete
MSNKEKIGIVYRTESIKLWRRFVFLGFILLGAHLLKLTPHEFSGMGFKVNVYDAKIIYGFLSLAVIYNFILACMHGLIGGGLAFIDPNQEIKNAIVTSLCNSDKSLTNDKAEKQAMWIYVPLIILFFAFSLIMAVFGLLVIATSFHDIYALYPIIEAHVSDLIL